MTDAPAPLTPQWACTCWCQACERLREAARDVVDERPMDWDATGDDPPRIVLSEVSFDLVMDRIDRLEAALAATGEPDTEGETNE